MSHTYHDALEGFDRRQILFDGCEECEARGADLQSAFAHMDGFVFARAWQRAFYRTLAQISDHESGVWGTWARQALDEHPDYRPKRKR